MSESDKVNEYKGTHLNIELKTNFDVNSAKNEYLAINKQNIDYDDMLKFIRKKSEDYYSKLRKDFYSISKKYIDIEEKKESSPFISYITNHVINDYSDISQPLYSLFNNDLIDKVYISKLASTIQSDPIGCVTQTCGSGSVNPTPVDPNYDISIALETSNVKDILNIYNGNGVKIGIHEAWYRKRRIEYAKSGLIDRYNLAISPSPVTYYNSKSDKSEHATIVAAVAGGKYGVARGANFLSTEVISTGLETYDYFNFEPIEWQIFNQSVNIINMSFNVDSFAEGSNNYNSLARKYDKYAFDNLVVFVVSAGNGISNLYTSSPANANNLITVGGTEIDGNNRYHTSRYVEKDGANAIFQKPNLVAPGKLWVPHNPFYDFDNPDLEIVPEGTSLSAPIVTGIIALAMQAHPLLKVYPELVHSLITSSANMSKFNYGDFRGGLEDQVGAGLVDAEKFISNAISNNYFLFTNNQNHPGIIKSAVVSLNAGQTLKTSLFWFSQINNNYNNRTITKYKLRIENLDGSLIKQIDYSNNLLIIEEKFYTSKTVRISVVLEHTKLGSYYDRGALSWNIN